MRLRVFWGLMGAVLLIGLVKLYGPLKEMRAQSVRMAQLRATKAELLTQQTDLEDYKRFLATKAGKEAAARQMGYLRPGERRLVFVPPKEAEKAKPDAKTEVAGHAPPSHKSP